MIKTRAFLDHEKITSQNCRLEKKSKFFLKRKHLFFVDNLHDLRFISEKSFRRSEETIQAKRNEQQQQL